MLPCVTVVVCDMTMTLLWPCTMAVLWWLGLMNRRLGGCEFKHGGDISDKFLPASDVAGVARMLHMVDVVNIHEVAFADLVGKFADWRTLAGRVGNGQT